MSWVGPVVGGLLSAGGQVGGGLLGSQGGVSPGQVINPTYSQFMDPAFTSSTFDALNQIGFGNINNVASPFEQLINRVNGTSVDTKTKRRALKYLLNLQRDNTGQPKDLQTAENIPNILGRRDQQSLLEQKNANAQDYGKGRFAQIQQMLGMTDQDVNDILAQDKAFKEQQKALSDKLGVLNKDTILNRANAASTSASLLGDASKLAMGGDPSTLQSGILSSLNRNLNDQENAILLRAQYGGFNPGEALRGIQNQRSDSTLTALQQAIGAANALTTGLNGGLSAAQTAAGQGVTAANNALGIAAQQANAANSLAYNSSVNQSDSLANGVAGGANQLSNSLLSYYLMNGNRSAPAYNGGGPGSTYNQNATSTSTYGGWNPNVNF